MIGLGASIVGLFSGLGLAVGLNALFKALNLDLPQTQTVFATRTIVVSLLVGTLVTLVAGLFPAIRATRVPPIAAVREGATLPRGRFARLHAVHRERRSSRSPCSRSATGRSPTTSPSATASRCSASASWRCSSGSRCSRRGSCVRSCGSSASPRGASGGAAGKLAEGNAQRNPGRTAATAAALMIGIALVTFVSVLAQRPARLEQRRDRAPDPVRPDRHVAGRLLRVPGRGGRRRRGRRGRRDGQQRPPGHRQIDGDGANLTGLDEQINEVYDFRWEEGSDDVLAQLGDDGAVLRTTLPRTATLRSATRSPCARPDNETKDFVVRGIYEGSPFYPLLGTASISQEAFDELYERPRNRFTLLNVAGDPAAAKPASRARSRASRTRASRRGRSGSTRRIRRSSSSCCCSTSCSRCR